MNNTYNETYDASNELSLKDFVFFFWHNKMWFFITAFIGVVIGIISIFMLSDWKKAELRVYPTSSEKLATLNEISRLTEASLPTNLPMDLFFQTLQDRSISERLATLNEISRPTEASLPTNSPMDLFFQTLQNRSKLAKSVALEAGKSNLDEESTSNFLSRLNISRREPSETQNEIRNALLDYINIEFKTTSFNQESVLLIDSLNRLENEAAQILKNQFLFRISKIEESIENQKQDLRLKIANARFSYQERLNATLSNLQENIEIAKTLGIRDDQILKNSSGAQSPSNEQPVQDNTNITLFSLEPSSIPDYYRGYVALQTQYDLISKRSNIDGFIPELANLKSELNSLENSPTIARLKKAYAKSILGKNEPIIIVEANNMITKRQIPAVAMLILPVFLMLLITSVFLIIRQILRSNRN